MENISFRARLVSQRDLPHPAGTDSKKLAQLSELDALSDCGIACTGTEITSKGTKHIHWLSIVAQRG